MDVRQRGKGAILRLFCAIAQYVSPAGILLLDKGFPLQDYPASQHPEFYEHAFFRSGDDSGLKHLYLGSEVRRVWPFF